MCSTEFWLLLEANMPPKTEREKRFDRARQLMRIIEDEEHGKRR
jgi:hypothetical protein